MGSVIEKREAVAYLASEMVWFASSTAAFIAGIVTKDIGLMIIVAIPAGLATFVQATIYSRANTRREVSEDAAWGGIAFKSKELWMAAVQVLEKPKDVWLAIRLGLFAMFYVTGAVMVILYAYGSPK